MTPTLLFARRAIIQWVTFWVTPFAGKSDGIEGAELDFFIVLAGLQRVEVRDAVHD